MIYRDFLLFCFFRKRITAMTIRAKTKTAPMITTMMMSKEESPQEIL